MPRASLLCLAALALLASACFGADLPEPDMLPSVPNLPDPLVGLDGKKVTTPEEWKTKRRPVLKALFAHYMYGPIPDAPAKITASVEHQDVKAFGGKATLQEVALTVGPPEAPRIRLLVVVPNTRKGRAPVFVGPNFSGNHALVNDPKIRIPTVWMYPGPGVKDNRATEEGRSKQIDVWALEQSIDRGYAVATFYNGDIDPDQRDVRGGLRPYLKPKDTGTIACWAWGIHRAVDYLLTRDDIDPKRICAVGHSRLGKTALLAAAFDERIALAIPHQAGCGGSAPSRQMDPKAESVKRINTSFPHWFNANFKKFNDHPDKLPFDQNGLVALCAPRPVLFSNASEDLWANPSGQFEVLKAAEGVYRLLGAGGLASEKMPEMGKLSDGVLGYYIRPGKHSMTKGDWRVFLDYADKRLGKPASATSARVKKLLLIGQGPDGAHPPGTHEYMPGLRVLASCLEEVKGVEVTVVQADAAWKQGPELLARSDGAVLFVAEGARWLENDPARKRAFADLLKRGGGLTALHWAMGTRDAGPIANCLDLLGGCHGGPDRKYAVLQTKARPAGGAHPATRGIEEFEVKDEFYYRLKLAKGQGLRPVLQADIEGRPETVAWAYERPAGGRAFGFSGLHFHDNWKLPEYRRLVAQGVLWTLGQEVPERGLEVKVPVKVLTLP